MTLFYYKSSEIKRFLDVLYGDAIAIIKVGGPLRHRTTGPPALQSVRALRAARVVTAYIGRWIWELDGSAGAVPCREHTGRSRDGWAGPSYLLLGVGGSRSETCCRG